MIISFIKKENVNISTEDCAKGYYSCLDLVGTQLKHFVVACKKMHTLPQGSVCSDNI